MTTITQSSPTAEPAFSESVRVQTTLYDLIAAINAEAGPDEDEAVIATLVHLLQTHRVTCVYGRQEYRLRCDDAAPLYSLDTEGSLTGHRTRTFSSSAASTPLHTGSRNSHPSLAF